MSEPEAVTPSPETFAMANAWEINLNEIADTIYQVALALWTLESIIERSEGLRTVDEKAWDAHRDELYTLLNDLRLRVAELEGDIRTGKRKVARLLGQEEPEWFELRSGAASRFATAMERPTEPMVAAALSLLTKAAREVAQQQVERDQKPREA